MEKVHGGGQGVFSRCDSLGCSSENLNFLSTCLVLVNRKWTFCLLDSDSFNLVPRFSLLLSLLSLSRSVGRVGENPGNEVVIL